MVDILVVAKENMHFLVLELFFGAIGAWGVSRVAHNFGFIDTPSGRSSHVSPTPKGGGVGILCAFVFCCFIFKFSLLFCLSITFLSLSSLVGDRIHLSPTVRLILQFFCAAIFVFLLPESPFFIHREFISSEYSLVISLVGGALAAVYIVGTANFYNFMDGINGIAGLTGVVGFGLLAGYGASCGKGDNFLMLSVGLTMACLGFLPFNIPKARVFMGDVGSIMLGFVFAVSVVGGAESVGEFIVLSSFLFPFYADELVTMVERIRRRQNLAKPHRSHLYQVLANEAGFTHWKVSFGYGFVQLFVGISVWYVSGLGLVPVFFALMLFGGVFVMASAWCKAKFIGQTL